MLSKLYFCIYISFFPIAIRGLKTRGETFELEKKNFLEKLLQFLTRFSFRRTSSTITEYKTCVINDPLGHTQVSPIATIIFCCLVLLDLKSGDGRTDGQHVQK